MYTESDAQEIRRLEYSFKKFVKKHYLDVWKAFLDDDTYTDFVEFMEAFYLVIIKEFLK